MGAIEGGTYVISAQFSDELGVTMVPTTVTWTLLDMDGDVINSRSDVSATAATTINIVLSGNDLAMEDNDSGKRLVLVEATYTSSYGAGLPLKKEYPFTIDRLTGVG